MISSLIQQHKCWNPSFLCLSRIVLRELAPGNHTFVFWNRKLKRIDLSSTKMCCRVLEYISHSLERASQQNTSRKPVDDCQTEADEVLSRLWYANVQCVFSRNVPIMAWAGLSGLVYSSVFHIYGYREVWLVFSDVFKLFAVVRCFQEGWSTIKKAICWVDWRVK